MLFICLHPQTLRRHGGWGYCCRVACSQSTEKTPPHHIRLAALLLDSRIAASTVTAVLASNVHQQHVHISRRCPYSPATPQSTQAEPNLRSLHQTYQFNELNLSGGPGLMTQEPLAVPQRRTPPVLHASCTPSTATVIPLRCSSAVCAPVHLTYPTLIAGTNTHPCACRCTTFQNPAQRCTAW